MKLTGACLQIVISWPKEHTRNRRMCTVQSRTSTLTCKKFFFTDAWLNDWLINFNPCLAYRRFNKASLLTETRSCVIKWGCKQRAKHLDFWSPWWNVGIIWQYTESHCLYWSFCYFNHTLNCKYLYWCVYCLYGMLRARHGKLTSFDCCLLLSYFEWVGFLLFLFFCKC